ncbi:MAG: PTS IIA-like nitrogen-regulatory protein PtsN [Pseudomonadales bacterium]|jgi:PTS system nitrogen regulatory IIA component|uniref:PTS IIA-like nitrogen regulatory protein PtsN n=1 Tax=unclassified Ketobacter TaxID=2639109 RepID=UPI000C4F1875|nr:MULTISPECIES: PTS IIA-like nitrogen regulatory protein PtsN [unclassified Ketobacter]MAA59449.1 PTS IIA-like nitrogen-regulatory protein PtsN [Pseudomonadales bacterium]MEC8811115.1 PTS IIA-like nitrogen regulatory protein PtsN [Pseudomonadota bacterium]TNC88619.1 MAG: PTS IIA-like nitrogen-regulatory protein PtsN [Alcanivorax sp.]HAG93378.1 PTS IIA-like nitrogen-regulatory protein PtsN [Gammaproteobacteria bacterium]MAQ25401.1 PTS IIA-like nitrogen-regulatory protein PtsN [Pseudomonadales |tara:strand:+ start:1152 stop:1604 length:453 start_codon:yes stop_codon:yes gene_type:complete
MELAEIISPQRVFEDVPGGSKKKVLETAAGLIAQQCPELDPNELFDNLISREKLGSTGLGKGIAIPHCRANHCSNAIGAFIKLESGVDFDSIDHEPVDMLFVLLVPQDAHEEHLNILSKIATLFNDDNRRKTLRAAHSTDSIYDALVTPV